MMYWYFVAYTTFHALHLAHAPPPSPSSRLGAGASRHIASYSCIELPRRKAQLPQYVEQADSYIAPLAGEYPNPPHKVNPTAPTRFHTPTTEVSACHL
jgi:hypothetical protein